MDNFFKERKDYQRYIVDYLVDKNKFIERYDNQGNFNPIYAMDTELVIKFLEETQPDKMEQIRKIHDNANELIIKRINAEITKTDSSLIQKLKKGVYFDNNIKLDLMYDKPATTFNEDLNILYQKNIFSVMEFNYLCDFFL